MKQLTIEPLTAEAFAEFGDVIETRDRDHFMINNGSTKRFHALSTVDLEGEDARAIISIFRAQKLDYPLSIAMVERHLLGSQAFIPLKGNPFLIVVAPKGDNPQPSQLRAFITDGTQGVSYGRGVWHHPILTIEPEDDFLVVDRAGSGNNCEEVHFDLAQQAVLSQ